jgi:large subunit ribosomal protein L23
LHLSGTNMALFNTSKKKGEAKDAPKEVKKVVAKKEVASKKETSMVQTQVFSKVGGIDLSMVLREPRITEKASMLAEKGAYVFDVHNSATKPLVAQAVKAKFGVTPEKVRMINIAVKRKQSRMTGVTHTSRGGRKAVVYLKKGDKIEFV